MKNKILYLVTIIFFISSYSFAGQRYNDVPDDAWYAKYVLNQSVIQGDGNKFRPNDNITRAEVAAIFGQQKSDEQKTIEAIKKVTQATVKVQTKRFVSAGFYISNDTVLSCYHTFKEEGIDDVTVKQDGITFNAKVIKVDKESDLVLIRVERYDNKIIVPLKIADKSQIGQTVLTTGFPFDHNLFTSKGILSQVDESVSIDPNTPSYKFNVVNMDINDGNSGGALYDIEGNIVGVIHAESTELKGFGYATRLEDINKFISNGL
jgi:serine protease Do